MKRMPVVVMFSILLVAAVPAFCQTRIYNRVQRKVSDAQLARAARVQLTFEYEKAVRLADYVHRRRPGFRDVVVKTEKKQKRCLGVLLANSRVATLAECAAEKDFELVQVRLTFSNGKTGVGKAGSVSVNEGIAHVRVSDSLTQGIRGLEAAYLPEEKSLQDVYGSELGTELQFFLASRGVLTGRRRMGSPKISLQKGEPFIWKGKVVALFNNVPKRLPVALFGQISEKFLSVLYR